MSGMLMKMVNRFTGGNENEVAASADAQRNQLVAFGNPAIQYNVGFGQATVTSGN